MNEGMQGQGARVGGLSLEEVEARLSRGLDGLGGGVDPRLAALERELREGGVAQWHEEEYARLHERREGLKRASGDLRAELDEPDYSAFMLLDSAIRARDAERARTKSEKGAKGLVKVNEEPETGGKEPVDARPDLEWPAYLGATAGAAADVSAVLVSDDEGGAGMCEGCGMWLPSHMDGHEDIFTGRKVTLCPMCNCCNHLEWAGLQKAGKVIWCPWLPQGFMSRIVVLTVLAAPYAGMYRWVSDRAAGDGFAGVGYLRPDTGVPYELSDVDELLERARRMPEGEGLSREDLRADLERFRGWHAQLGHMDADRPGAELSPGRLAVSIMDFYSWLADSAAPLEELLGGGSGSGESLDVSDPLFWAEQMRAEGFTRHEVGRLLAGVKGGMEGEAGLRASSMGAVFSRLAGLRFLPDADWWSALVEGPWGGYLKPRYGPQTWGALLHGMGKAKDAAKQQSKVKGAA